jgi:hypothetical protein
MIPDCVDTEVVIHAVHGPRTWHAELPNGKCVMAFLEKEDPLIELRPGARVKARLTVADFSRARVLPEMD